MSTLAYLRAKYLWYAGFRLVSLKKSFNLRVKKEEIGKEVNFISLKFWPCITIGTNDFLPPVNNNSKYTFEKMECKSLVHNEVYKIYITDV